MSCHVMSDYPCMTAVCHVMPLMRVQLVISMTLLEFLVAHYHSVTTTKLSHSALSSVSYFFFSCAFHDHNWAAYSSAECSRDKPPFSLVRGQDSTM